MILIKCGTCGTSQGYKTASDGALSLPAAEERRLVARGVAEYVTRPIIGPASDADSPVEGEESGGAGIDPSDEDPPVEGFENGGSGIPPRDLPGSAEMVDIIDGHFDRESLLKLSRPQMETLAKDLGVDVRKCKNKGDIADLLVEIEVAAPAEADSEFLPELGAEAPVV